ncbi:MAG: C40 family peptidase [Clostridia bacterium]|nr:C40 family peptidase [Clostridia bacterium]
MRMSRRLRFRPHRAARFLLIQTVALWLCLAVICLACSGFTQGEVVALRAMEHLGKPYALGAAGPDRFDCSGLVMYCLEPEGFEFPYHAAAVIGTDARYPLIKNPRDLLVGDVVCFDTVQDHDPSDHMGFYIGGNQFVHASSTGEVKISALEGYYLERFTGARRYAQVYCYLPTGAQLAAWFVDTGIPGAFEIVKERAALLWNSFFKRL